jgi:hypothetical protein
MEQILVMSSLVTNKDLLSKLTFATNNMRLNVNLDLNFCSFNLVVILDTLVKITTLNLF